MKGSTISRTPACSDFLDGQWPSDYGFCQLRGIFQTNFGDWKLLAVFESVRTNRFRRRPRNQLLERCHGIAPVYGILLRGTMVNRTYGTHKKLEIVRTFPIGRSLPKHFVRKIQRNRRSPRAVPPTIQSYVHHPKSIIQANPIDRQPVIYVVKTNPNDGQPPKSIARIHPMNRQPPR